MAPIEKRQLLHQYIDNANNHDVDTLFDYIDNGMNPDLPYNKWEDPEFVQEMDKRVNELESGLDKGYTWDEVKALARKSVKK